MCGECTGTREFIIIYVDESMVSQCIVTTFRAHNKVKIANAKTDLLLKNIDLVTQCPSPYAKNQLYMQYSRLLGHCTQKKINLSFLQIF